MSLAKFSRPVRPDDGLQHLFVKLHGSHDQGTHGNRGPGAGGSSGSGGGAGAEDTTHPFKAGDRVKYSDSEIQHQKQQRLGRSSESDARAMKYINEKAAMRGTVTEAFRTKSFAGSKIPGAPGVEIKWDNGTTSRTATYLVQKV